MCFGGSEVTKSTATDKTMTSTPDPEVKAAALGNINYVQNLRDTGFTPYGGKQVADFSPMQQNSFDMAQGIATDPTAQNAASLIYGYTGGGPQQIKDRTGASYMSPYMNQYAMMALAPQLEASDLSWAKARAATDAQATGSGAFGDARTGIEQSENNFFSNVAREGLIGNAYNHAFDTAVSAGGADASRNLQGQIAQGGFGEQYLNRQLGGASALEQLQNQRMGISGSLNQLGQQQTAQQQAMLTGQYNQWLMGQQYPFQTAALMNQTTGVGAGAIPAAQHTVGNETQSAPDNSGFAALGGLATKLLPLAFSDARLKEDIHPVGELRDGSPVYSYRYKGDPSQRTQIGLMAQDVKQRRPDAVVTLDDPDGTMMVDYSKATERSRLLSMSI